MAEQSKVVWFLGVFVLLFVTLFQAGERTEVAYLGDLKLEHSRPIQVGYAHREYYLFGVAVRVFKGDYHRVRQLNTKDPKGRPSVLTTQREKLTEEELAAFAQTPFAQAKNLPWKVRYSELYNLFWRGILFLFLLLLYLRFCPELLRKHRFSVTLPEALTRR